MPLRRFGRPIKCRHAGPPPGISIIRTDSNKVTVPTVHVAGVGCHLRLTRCLPQQQKFDSSWCEKRFRGGLAAYVTSPTNLSLLPTSPAFDMSFVGFPCMPSMCLNGGNSSQGGMIPSTNKLWPQLQTARRTSEGTGSADTTCECRSSLKLTRQA